MTATLSEAEIAALNATFDRSALQLSKTHLHYHTIQLLNRSKSGEIRYAPGGSGVLVQMGQRYFIFTAAHVTANFEQEGLFVNTRIGIRHVIGTVDETDYERDMMVDMAYIELERIFALLLTESYTYLPFEKLDLGHQPAPDIQYLVSGYPERNIRIDQDSHTVTTGTSHFLLSMANEKPYQFYHIPPEACFVLNFGGAGFDLGTGQKEKGIEDPFGISGCGLWRLMVQWNRGRMSLDYRLIGIMFLVKKGKYHILVGNRIELLISKLNAG
jgi:hypothetical protein